MSYIGRGLQSGAFRQLDSIASSFDGSTTGFTMQVNSTNVIMGDANQILLSLGGVIQKPGTDFTISSSTLTFTTAPATGTSFFAILLGSDNGGTVTPTDGSVTGDKIASNAAITTTGAANFNGGITMGGTTPTLTIGDAGAEDTKIVFDGNAQDFHIGLDDSADSLIMGLGSALGTTSHMVIDSSGAITKPLQPAFSVNDAGTTTNLSSGAAITFGTEVFDLNADFASNTFTAPVTGKYQISYQLRFQEFDADFTYFLVQLTTSNRSYSNILSGGQHDSDAAYISFHQSILCDMDANDTCDIAIAFSGGAAQCDVATREFTGVLVC
jgi:hypothetical protein